MLRTKIAETTTPIVKKKDISCDKESPNTQALHFRFALVMDHGW